jgi:Polyketide cyclase / dehydrase and lipid transport
MAWRFEHSADSIANPEAVWRHYVDVEHWCDWSKQGVEWSRIDGPFEVGTKGRSKAPGSRALAFTLIRVQQDSEFASQVRLPGARLTFEHVIEPLNQGSRITHRTTLDGPFSFLYAPLVRRSVERGLPDGVNHLADMAAN